MARTRALSRDEARRCAVAAAGLADPRPSGPVDGRHLRRVLRRLSVIQIDSVNVLARAHYVPFFSRLGPYDPSILDRLAAEDEVLFEYWGHVASLVPVEHHRLLRWRMQDPHWYQGMRRFAERHGPLVEELHGIVRAEGPVAAAELEQRDGPKGPWWDWSDTKGALELLFQQGRVAVRRRGNFERVYLAPEDAIPHRHLDAPTPPPDEARAELVVLAARAHGVATDADLADYWRMKTTDVRRVLPGLVEDGRLEVVEVEGWGRPAYKHPDAVVPRQVDARAVVSPFDQVMWERGRVLRLHDFHYRIGIYTPADRRDRGYYSLPFLLGDTFVGQVDLKADRRGRRLLVEGAWAEPDLDARGTSDLEVAEALAAELRLVASWLDLDDVVVRPVGDLAEPLVALVGAVG